MKSIGRGERYLIIRESDWRGPEDPKERKYWRGFKNEPPLIASNVFFEACWAAFLGGLRDRGLSGVRLVVSDDHAGLVAAVGRLFQGCAWQRCVTHLQRNLASLASGRPERQRRMVTELVHAACYQADPDLAHLVWQRAEPWVSKASRRAGEAFAAAEDSALAFMESHLAKRLG